MILSPGTQLTAVRIISRVITDTDADAANNVAIDPQIRLRIVTPERSTQTISSVRAMAMTIMLILKMELALFKSRAFIVSFSFSGVVQVLSPSLL